MSKGSKRLRDKAADELRSGRQSRSTVGRGEHKKRAASYKELASNEEWLSGEPPRSRKRSPKKN